MERCGYVGDYCLVNVPLDFSRRGSSPETPWVISENELRENERTATGEGMGNCEEGQREKRYGTRHEIVVTYLFSCVILSLCAFRALIC